VEQREGRILRQGNENDEVEIFRYVTKGTFDAYNWNILVNKQRFISQVATAKNVTRECEDIGGEELSYAEVMAIASGNPYIREMNEVESQLRKLKTYKKSYDDTHMALRLAVEKNLPKKIDKYSKMRQAVCDDIERRDSYLSLHTLPSGKKIFEMTIGGKVFNDKTEANEYILMCMDKVIPGKESVYGEYMGFKFTFEQPISFIDSDKYIRLIGAHEYTRPAGADNVQILQNLMGTFEKQLSSLDEQIVETEKNLENSISELNKPFAHQDSLNTLMQRYEELKTLLTPAETDREEAKETDNCRTAASR
jgi:hypothetical protein